MKAQWISETEAAEKIGYDPRTLRRNAKAGKLPINYTSINNRNFFYNEIDIEKLLIMNAAYPIKSKSQVQWIKEKEAAEKVGLKPLTLRRHCRSGRLLINHTYIFGRSYQYNLKDIEKLLQEQSSYVN